MLSLKVIATNIQTCSRCVGKGERAGIMLCPVDGATCVSHAQDGECPKRLLKTAEEPKPTPMAKRPCIPCGQKILNGAIGLAKVAAQAVGIPIDQAPRKVEAKRFRICTICAPGAVLCPKCDCIIAAKVKINSEKCPIEKW